MQMAKNNPTAVEQGLAETETFLASPEFKKLYEIMKREVEKYGSRIIDPGLTDEQIKEFAALCEKRFGCAPPQGYLAFLKVMNGYEFDAFVIYDYAHPDIKITHFFEDNACYIDNLRLSHKIVKRKHLLIGRDNEGYYSYNLKTGAYAYIGNIFLDEMETYASFADMFVSMMLTAIDSDDLYALFPKRAERYRSDSEPLLSWDDPRMIAWALLQGYAKPIDVLSLSDGNLLEMLEDEGVLDMLPPMNPAERENVLFTLKCAIARQIEGDDKFDPFQNDAEI
jgi:hypothetical protein